MGADEENGMLLVLLGDPVWTGSGLTARLTVGDITGVVGGKREGTWLLGRLGGTPGVSPGGWPLLLLNCPRRSLMLFANMRFQTGCPLCMGRGGGRLSPLLPGGRGAGMLGAFGIFKGREPPAEAG